MEMNQLVIVITISSVVGLILLGGIGIGATMIIRPKILLRRRMQAIGVIGGGSQTTERVESRRQRRIQDQVKQLGKKEKRGFADNLSDAILQAGLDVSINVFFMISVGVGILMAFLYLVTGMPPVGAILAALIGIFGLPKLFLRFMAKRRQKKFTLHFADAIDLIVRGIKSGLPINECFNVIAREFDPPLGEEFRLIIEGQNLGITLDDLMARGLRRLPTSEYKFFAIVMQIQRQTGGNLADTLSNLSGVLRERKQLRDKIQAMAAEAKASAGIIGSLPFIVAALLSVVNPDYLMLLITEKTGNYILAAGAFWLTLGVTVMRKMIHFKV